MVESECLRSRGFVEYTVSSRRYSQETVAEVVDIVSDRKICPQSLVNRIVDALSLSFNKRARKSTCKERS